MKRLTIALIMFAGGCASVVHHHDRPTLPTQPVTASDAPTRLSEHPSRGGWRSPLVALHSTPVVRRGRWRLATVTAYCATGHPTASGLWPRVGMAAGNAWALGTRLRIRGHGTVVVTDRSAPGATDIDLYLGSGSACVSDAAAFGRRQLPVAEAHR